MGNNTFLKHSNIDIIHMSSVNNSLLEESMRITTKGRYALRACLALAKLGQDGTPVSIRELSGYEEISPVFLEQIFFKLRKAGIISSVRGPGGGFRFAKSLEETNLKAIIEASDENVELTPCTGGKDGCNRDSECLAHTVWLEATALLNDYLENTSLQSLKDRFPSFFEGSTEK